MALEQKANQIAEGVECGIRLRLDQLTEINTVDQTYHILSVVDLDWPASENDVAAYNKDPANYVPEKRPRIEPINFVSKTAKTEPWSTGNAYKVIYHNGEYFNARRIEYDCVWSEVFEVKKLSIFIFLLLCCNVN